MPHPEQEHALMIEVARLQKRVDDGDATARILAKDVRAWSDKCDELREALAAANARADAAQEGYDLMTAKWDGVITQRNEAQEALAAARRECEALRAALNTIRRGGGGMDPLGRMEMSRIARDALAVRAAGEEK